MPTGRDNTLTPPKILEQVVAGRALLNGNHSHAANVQVVVTSGLKIGLVSNG